MKNSRNPHIRETREIREIQKFEKTARLGDWEENLEVRRRRRGLQVREIREIQKIRGIREIRESRKLEIREIPSNLRNWKNPIFEEKFRKFRASDDLKYRILQPDIEDLRGAATENTKTIIFGHVPI